MPPTKSGAAIAALVTLSACGGGGSANGNDIHPIPGPTTQSAGGIWTSEYTETSGPNTGDVINAQGIVSESGGYFAYSQNTTNGCAGMAFGQLAVNGSSVSGTETAAIIRYSNVGLGTNCVYPDGSFSATGTLTGTVSQRVSLTLTATGTTSMGGALPSDTISFNFSSLYLNPSSLAAIAGNYNHSGATMTVDANGNIFEQDPNGCVLSGQVSIIDAAYNAYGVQLSFANCTGLTADFNGVTASGLVTLDTATTPETLVGGISATVNSQPFLEVFNLPRM